MTTEIVNRILNCLLIDNI